MKKIIAILCLSIAQLASATETTITFNDLSSPLEQDLASYTFDGYSITSSVKAPNAFVAWGSTSQFYSGSAALGAAYFDSLITLKRNDNATFNLTSIDMETLFTSTPYTSFIVPGSVLLTGVASNNTLVSQTISISGLLVSQLTTHAITGFNNVTSVYWRQGLDLPGDINDRHQFDNIVLNTSPVPEPSTALLLSGALMSFVSLRRKYLA